MHFACVVFVVCAQSTATLARPSGSASCATEQLLGLGVRATWNMKMSLCTFILLYRVTAQEFGDVGTSSIAPMAWAAPVAYTPAIVPAIAIALRSAASRQDVLDSMNGCLRPA